MKLEYVVFLLLVQIASTVAVPGGWSPITNINDPYVRQIAEFAVNDHDKRTGQNFKLQRVIKGQSQVVAGVRYDLTFAVTDGSASHIIEATVQDQPWIPVRIVSSWHLISP